ncbi:MAG: permease, partial [Candidatus Aminicenantes bacterium]|nr:permease [Candidatus Aminicenantes bacterium]
MTGPVWLTLLASFGGGIAGAAFGAVPMFVLCGLASVAGTVITIISGDASFQTHITWGPFLGPHVAFAGGVAAAAYAARKGLLSSGRDIVTPLLKLGRPDVLLIGGLFGVLGSLLAGGWLLVPNGRGTPWKNAIALSIVVSGFIVRLLFGKTGLLGKPCPGTKRWAVDRTGTNLPWRMPPLQLAVLSLGFALPAAISTVAYPQTTGIFFSLAAVSLVFLAAGAKAPVVLHIVLAAELFALAGHGVWLGVLMGLAAAAISEAAAVLFLIYGDTHIDPPAVSLAIL